MSEEKHEKHKKKHKHNESEETHEAETDEERKMRKKHKHKDKDLADTNEDKTNEERKIRKKRKHKDKELAGTDEDKTNEEKAKVHKKHKHKDKKLAGAYENDTNEEEIEVRKKHKHKNKELIDTHEDETNEGEIKIHKKHKKKRKDVDLFLSELVEDMTKTEEVVLEDEMKAKEQEVHISPKKHKKKHKESSIDELPGESQVANESLISENGYERSPESKKHKKKNKHKHEFLDSEWQETEESFVDDKENCDVSFNGDKKSKKRKRQEDIHDEPVSKKHKSKDREETSGTEVSLIPENPKKSKSEHNSSGKSENEADQLESLSLSLVFTPDKERKGDSRCLSMKSNSENDICVKNEKNDIFRDTFDENCESTPKKHKKSKKGNTSSERRQTLVDFLKDHEFLDISINGFPNENETDESFVIPPSQSNIDELNLSAASITKKKKKHKREALEGDDSASKEIKNCNTQNGSQETGSNNADESFKNMSEHYSMNDNAGCKSNLLSNGLSDTGNEENLNDSEIKRRKNHEKSMESSQDSSCDDGTSTMVNKSTTNSDESIASSVNEKQDKLDIKADNSTVKKRKRMISVLAERITRRENLYVDTENKSIIDGNVSIDELLDKAVSEQHLSESQLGQLSNLFVTVPWPIPPLHLLETRVVSRPSKQQHEKINGSGIPVKTGPYTKAEDDIIKANWEEFCKLHNLDNDPIIFLNFKHPNSEMLPTCERLKFVRFLAHGLDNRLLVSVYTRFQRLFLKGRIKIGRFSPDEDRIILEYVEKTKSQTPFADLAKILKRNNVAVEKRYLNLISENKPLRWTDKKIRRFVKRLVKITGSANVAELKDKTITTMEWQQLSKKLDIPLSKLQRAWNCTIYPRIFIKESVQTEQIREKIIDILYENGEEDWRSVNWKEVAKHFEGFTSDRINRLFKDVVSYHVPKKLQKDLKESLKYLKDVFLQNCKLQTKQIKKVHLDDF